MPRALLTLFSILDSVSMLVSVDILYTGGNRKEFEHG